MPRLPSAPPTCWARALPLFSQPPIPPRLSPLGLRRWASTLPPRESISAKLRFASTKVDAIPFFSRSAIPSSSSAFAALPTKIGYFSSHRSLSTASASVPSSVTPLPASEAVHPDPPEVALTAPLVGKYLLLIAGMVFLIVIVGGMTRLTESGLSITEWNVVSGVVPPLNQRDWEGEFEKYKATPEWRLQNQHITLSEFKTIYFWEWSHRILGRVIGLTFLLPLPYFFLRRHLTPASSLRLLGIGSLIGAQGALGWYMVKSGLDEQSVQDLGGVARVSQYRLAAHLGMAFLVFAASVRMALGVGRDWKLVQKRQGLAGINGVGETMRRLELPQVKRVRMAVTAVTALIFLTAISGAFVAGLDAGLVYNEFPLMGGRLVPPTSELFVDNLARKPDKSDRWWRNLFENPTTVQFDHRVLAITTSTSIVTLFLFARRPSIKPHLPPTTYRLIKGTMHMSFLQVALGISTLIYLVPIHLAATHQAGSLVLLTLALASGASLRRPGKVVKEIMRLRSQTLVKGAVLSPK